MPDISKLMEKVENNIIDAIDGIHEILALAEPQDPDSRQDIAELDYFLETLEKAYNRAKSSINNIFFSY